MVATYDDFTKLEIRTVRITSVEAIEGKTRIALGVIDTGECTMQVIIGGADKFDPTSLIGVQAVAVTNMVPKTIAGITSEAMLLAADVDGVPFWLTPNIRYQMAYNLTPRYKLYLALFLDFLTNI